MFDGVAKINKYNGTAIKSLKCKNSVKGYYSLGGFK